ncbi:MAG: hypothetical protein IKE18_08230 [Oscillospiraceae bacterium]|nr:hypothetical protein [Oscillospiraceae bacterium]
MFIDGNGNYEEDLENEVKENKTEGEYAEVINDGEDFSEPDEVTEETLELDEETRGTKGKASFVDAIGSIVESKYGKLKLGALILLLILAVGFTVAAAAGAFSGKKPGTAEESSGSEEISEVVSESSVFESVPEVIKKEEEYTSVILGESPNAGDNYIQDTLFVGDSNTVRLSYFGIVPSNSSAGIVGIGIKDISSIKGVFFYDLAESPTTVMRAVELMQPRRIIINFGTNDVYRNNVKDFIDAYREAIAQLQKTYPYADIIIDAIHPVGASGEYPDVKQSVIDDYNEALVDLADELGLHFLNSCEVLKGTNGYAKTGYVEPDGIHLTKEAMKVYVDYVKTHSHIVEDTRPAVTNVPRKKEVDYVPGGLSGGGRRVTMADKGTILDAVNSGLSSAGFKFDSGSEDLSDSSKWKSKDYQVSIAESDYKKGNEAAIANSIISSLSGVQADYVRTSIAEILNDKGEVSGAVFTLRAYTKVEAKKYKITIGADPSGAGNVTANKQEAIEKDVVSISAKASSGYKFSEWRVSGGTVTDPKSVNTTVTVGTSDITITAVFVKDEHVHTLQKQNAVAATCSKEGYKEYWQCTSCNKMFSDAEGKNQISKPESVPKTDHSWGDWTVTAATCGKDGKQERKCSVCGAVDAQTIPATGNHSWGGWSTTTAATCGKEGQQKRTCSVCGAAETQTIPATGAHTWSDWSTTTAATCGKEGQQKRTCSVCAAVETQTIPATGAHTWSDWSTVTAATCGDDGQQKRTCSVCGAAETQAIPATGAHTWSDWSTTIEPTCGAEGQLKRRCSVCGAEETQAISATGNHAWSDWTVTANPAPGVEGSQQRTCSVCGVTQTQVIPALPVETPQESSEQTP